MFEWGGPLSKNIWLHCFLLNFSNLHNTFQEKNFFFLIHPSLPPGGENNIHTIHIFDNFRCRYRIPYPTVHLPIRYRTYRTMSPPCTCDLRRELPRSLPCAWWRAQRTGSRPSCTGSRSELDLICFRSKINKTLKKKIGGGAMVCYLSASKRLLFFINITICGSISIWILTYNPPYCGNYLTSQLQISIYIY